MKSRILIDADGCPVVDLTVCIAKEYGAECLILCDTSHWFDKPGAKTLIFSKGADSVDFALVNLLHRGDIVVTQDYGLAAMCLARGAVVLRQDGLEYTAENMDALLMVRHTARKARKAGIRLNRMGKRPKSEDQQYERALRCVLEHAISQHQTDIQE